MNAKEVVRFTDEALAAAADEALEALTPRARAHALAVAGGKTAAEAARELGTSTNGRVLARMKARTAPVLALLREQMRRKSHLSAESAARWFEDVADEARRAKDYGAATRAKSEAAKILGLYPDVRLHVDHTLIDAREVTPEELEALSRLRHEVRPRLTAHMIEAHFEPVPVPGDHETPLPQSKAGDCASQDREVEADDAA
jgi:hypothetical protein